MSDVLIVTQARNIQVCIESYRALPIEKVWFTGYTEQQLAPLMDRFIRDTRYDDYLIVSDDLIANQRSLQMIRQELREKEVVTGWCKQSPASLLSNVRLKPWRDLSLFRFSLMTRYAGRYGFATTTQVRSQPKVFRTYFAGGCLTGMRRQVWLDHPFRPMHKHGGSDYVQCKDLMEAGIPIWCVREAYMDHLKSKENWLIGKVEPRVTFEPLAVEAEYDLDYIR